MAALMAAMAGGVAIVGKLSTGWLYDRGVGGWINVISMGLPAVAAAILVLGGTNLPLILLAVAIIGYSNGAFIQVCAYLTGRYGGIRNYGKIYGVMASMIALGLGVGPVISGLIYDASGGYGTLLVSAVPAAILGGILISALGPYPVWKQPDSPVED